MNIWVIGPGTTLNKQKKSLEKLNDRTTLALGKVFPNSISSFNLHPTWWTWFDPHEIVYAKPFLKDNPEHKIKIVLASPGLKSKKDFHSQFPHTNSFLNTKRDAYNLVKIQGGTPHKNWEAYEEFLTNDLLDITWIESVCLQKLYRKNGEQKNLGERLANEPDFRFNEFGKVVIGTHYSNFAENAISRYILPLCQGMGFKKVFIAGFDGQKGRFYANANPFRKKVKWKCSPYVGKFYNLKKWVDWVPHTGMEVFSVVRGPIDKHIPKLSFDEALEMDS